MNGYLFSAGVITILVGLIHSILGERQIFHDFRERGLVPTNGRPTLKQSHLRIIWATWHLSSIFGFVFAAILFYFALSPEINSTANFVLRGVAVGMFCSSILVAYATQGKHPGWIGLFAVTILIILGI